MHELAITQNLIALVEEECKKQHILNPTKIMVDLGFFTTYSKESILFYYNLLRKEIPLLSKTKLKINTIEGKIQCNECNIISTVKDPRMILCQRCHSLNVHIVQGKEFILREICIGE
jgi:hydrogenase nickel incorporation protein HypA/HybF